MESPKDSLELIRRRLPQSGQAFVLRDAVDAMDASYREDRLGDDAEDSVIAVCTKPTDDLPPRLELGICRMFGLFNQLEVSLQYPVNWRSLFLNRRGSYCETLADSANFFAGVRMCQWYRRYATVKATCCVVRWHGEDEMASVYVEQVLPIFANQKGSELCRLANPSDQA